MGFMADNEQQNIQSDGMGELPEENRFEGKEEGSYYMVVLGHTFNIRNIAHVRKLLEDALMVGHKKIFFDLQKCEHIDSSALGLIINTFKKCSKNEEGIVALYCPSRTLIDQDIPNMLKVIPVVRSKEELESYL